MLPGHQFLIYINLNLDMKIIEFWDKESPVNGVPANKILEDAFFSNARSLFLIKDDVANVVSNIESVDIIRSNMEMGTEYTDEDVAEAYLDFVENPPQPMMMAAENEISVEIRLANMEGKLDQVLSILNAK